MLHQDPAAQIVVKIPVVQRIDTDAKPIPQIPGINAADEKRLIADDLRRHKFVDLIQELSLFVQLRHHAFSRGNIRDGNAKGIIHADNTHNVIVLGLIQTLGAQCSTRRHHADDFTFYDPFRLFRVLHLLTDCNFVAFLHQTVDIRVRRMVRDPAHGRPFLQAAVLSGQCQFQFPGHQNRIIEKHFIKITQTVK